MLIAALLTLAAFVTPPPDSSDTVLIPASDFIGDIQKGHIIADADDLGLPWVFNNTALVMGSRSNYVRTVHIPEAGAYYLYAHTHGKSGTTLRVSINNQVIGEDLADEPLKFERAGRFDLEKGPATVRLMRVERGPVMDVLVLSKRDDLTEEDLKAMQLHPDVRLLKSYTLPEPGLVKFGDVTGDGRPDLLLLTDDYSAFVFDHDGRPLWSYRSGSDDDKDEPPGVIWDLDGDGPAEVVHWRLIDGKEYLVAADGRTGAVKHKTLWTSAPLPHPFYNYRLAVARLRPGYPNQLLTFTDTGGFIVINAYDAGLNRLWTREEEKKKDHLGHYVYPVDLDGDGIDEVLAGSLLLGPDGSEIWNDFGQFFDHHDHADSYRFADLDGDGRREIVIAHSEVGVMARDALTGRILWQQAAEHTQQVETGAFLRGAPTPQVAVTARTYGNRQAGEPYLSGQIWYFDRAGRYLSRWPAHPVNGNPDFVKGDWAGDGKEELFWYKFHVNPDGTGTLYFPDPVYHMFDFTGDRAEEVITLNGNVLSVYGSRRADPGGEPLRRSVDYRRHEIANHTHY